MTEEFRTVESEYRIYGITDMPESICHFCGNYVSVYHQEYKGRDRFFVACVTCGANGPIMPSELSAVNKWNNPEHLK